MTLGIVAARRPGSRRREKWPAENARGMSAYNLEIGEHGGFGDNVRRF